MADETIPTPPEDRDILELDTEIPVDIDTLEVTGTRPEMGDQVTLKIDGVVQHIEDDCVYVLPKQINGQDLAQILAKHGLQNDSDDGTAEQLIRKLTQQADQAGTPLGAY